MNDGTEAEFGPGDARYVSPGHDAWVVGEEPLVVIDFTGPAQAAGASAQVACDPCGVEFRIGRSDQIDHLIAAVQEHASGSHGHALTREHILSQPPARLTGAATNAVRADGRLGHAGRPSHDRASASAFTHAARAMGLPTAISASALATCQHRTRPTGKPKHSPASGCQSARPGRQLTGGPASCIASS